MPRVHVHNVPESVTVEQFGALCRRLGLVGEVHFARDPVSGCYEGKAYLACETDDEARAAVTALSGYALAGAHLQVEVSDASGFFDADGLFADGSAPMGRRDGGSTD